MSSRQRIILLVVAAVVLVGGIALASSSGDDDDDTATTETTAAPPAETSEAPEEASPAETQETPAEEQPAAPTVETIRIKGGKPVGGVRTLEYENGDTIALRFASDKALEVHIHGYDREFALEPGVVQVTRFKANLEGIFDIEEHETEELLAKLEVSPK